MSKSIFQILGPVMIGPSSSHTAGAVRLANLGRQISGKGYQHVIFEFHGSFAHTYRGHGTDRALVAGALGYPPDDDRIPDSFQHAKDAGLTYEFREVEIDGAHPNTVRMTFLYEDGRNASVTGSSIGGGNVIITSVNDMKLYFTAEKPTLVVRYHEQKGMIAYLSNVLFENHYNIANMRTIRENQEVLLITELDEPLRADIVERIRQEKEFISLKYLQKGEF